MRGLESFSNEEIEKASSVSPAVANYCRHIQAAAPDFSSKLRQIRHRAWLSATLNTYFQSATTEEICLEWSKATDEIIKKAWIHVGLADAPAALFALGKLGSCELNLSSDIDVIVVGRKPFADDLESKVRQFSRLLSESTAFGFAYRVDFDLRPGGNNGSLVTSLDQFERHYWSQGEPWERLALTRLRGVCGDASVIRETEDLGARFSYRKFLDLTLLEDLKSLRQKIHQNLAAQGYRPETNLKLGIGGIRDIELFLQSLIVIHGGRIPQLRKRRVPEIAETLKGFKLLPSADADFLVEAYWFLRDFEHRIQLIRDIQTHTLPQKPLPIELVPKTHYKRLTQITSGVDQIVSSLLGKVDLKAVHLPTDLEAQSRWLQELQFSEVSCKEVWPSLIETTTLTQKNRHSENARQEFLFLFVKALHEAGFDQDMGLSFLLDFIKATRAKSSFYSLLIREEKLLNDLALLFSVSPYLSQVLCSRPELVDSLLLRSQEPFSKDFDQMLDEMAEQKMLTEFIGALDFLATRNLPNLFLNLSSTADRICLHLLNALKQQIGASSLTLLCLGKWGGRDLGLRSDLDFIFVTEAPVTETDTKIARRFISRLQDPHRGGRLYGLDLRLRPSGAAGPLIVTQSGLTEYLETKAEAWQRQSYLRARYLEASFGPKSFSTRGLTPEELLELRSIREKLTTGFNSSEEINIKFSRGGLIDIELCIQTLLLFHRISPESTRTDEQAEELHRQLGCPELLALKTRYLELRTVEQLIKLLQQSDTLTLPKSDSVKQKLLRILGIEQTELETYLAERLRLNEQCIKALDPIWA